MQQNSFPSTGSTGADARVRRLTLAAETVLIGLPVLSLLVMALAWLRYGTDLPSLDDFRAYAAGNAASLEWAHLFKSENDTLSVTTRVLDALAQRYLDGNSIAYQLLSMLAVLGSLLWLQWKLLERALPGRLLAACAFSTSLLMLQPGSYWGWQNMAYVQAIPLVCILGLLYIATCCAWRPALKYAALFVIALLSGLSYISGAFAVVVLAATWLLACAIRRGLWPRYGVTGLFVLAGGVTTSVVQAWVIMVVQHGHTHRADAAWALPTDTDFWFYLLGKVGRSLMLPASSPAWSLPLTIMALLIVAVLVAVMTHRLWKKREAGEDFDSATAIILLSLVGVIASYLFMVAAGRANLRPASADTDIRIFQFGYHRFHFFWVTALWPWVFAAACLLLGEGRSLMRASRAKVGTGLMAVLLSMFALSQGAMSHNAHFGDISAHRASNDIPCIALGLLDRSDIVCPTVFGTRSLSAAYRYGLRTGASFTRYFPPALLAHNSVSKARQYHPLSLTDGYEIKHADGRLSESGTLEIATGRDVNLYFVTGEKPVMRDCLVLRASAKITATKADVAQLFYLPMGETHFKELHSSKASVAGKAPTQVEFTMVSRTGYQDRFRLDPVTKTQASTVADLSLSCLLPMR